MVGIVSPIVSAEPASTAQQAAAKQAEFNRIQAQANEIDDQLDVIVEQYNERNLTLSKTEKELQSQKARLLATEKDLTVRQSMINKRFASVYRQGGTSFLEALLNSKNLDQFLYYLELFERQSDQDVKIMDQLKSIKKDIEIQSAGLLEKERKQRELVAEVKSKKDEIAAQLKVKNDLLAQVKGQLAELRKKQRAEQAELRKKFAAMPIQVSRGGSRSGIIGIAMSLLGRPYVYGAGGPGSFDCSGFTSYVYRQVGVSLPHSAAGQYGCGTHISRDELQPGDLVFFAHGGYISHVGIYIGGSSFIHAPRTGEVVSIMGLSQHAGYVGAARP